MSEKAKIAVNRSLSRLSDLVSTAGIHLQTPDKSSSPPAKSPEAAAPVNQAKPEPKADDALFIEAMDGVHRSSWRHDPHPASLPAPTPVKDSDSENRRLMEAAINTDTPLPIPDHPEYIEGWIGVAGKKFLPNLRNGLYSIQGQIDLHGYNRIEAQIVVEDFIARMAQSRSYCVKIIHGRGINSPTDKATLKESLQRVLTTRRMSRYVVAYASAPVCDGGVGAVYVLLRRQ